MVLVMFVDSGMAALLPALAGGRVYVSPSILDAAETAEGCEPISEFMKGLSRFRRLDDDLSRLRLERRQDFLGQSAALWQPATPTLAELQLAHELTKRETRARAKAQNTALRIARVDPGEAEAAALAITRGWTFWSDDNGIVPLIRTLYPAVTLERTCALVARAVNERLLSWVEGHQLFEGTFKGQLDLHTTARLVWEAGEAKCVV
ncbi:hypothetical protein Dxin01_03977 [Deinococcus xinjiangensis]|uniref:Uncharacterized protein n=2 Tax=Deinococcus xinjiangensis TaxID=457454 RepID=A0ABP9VG67_9DEIO